MGCSIKQWRLYATVALALTLAASLWLTLSFYFSVATDVRCVISGLGDIAALQPVSGGSGFDLQDLQEAVANINQELLNLLDRYSQFAGVVTALPGALAAFFLLLAMCCAHKSEGGVCCTRTMIVLFDVFAILQFGVCIFAGGAGIATTQPSVASITGDFQSSWTSTCDTETAALRNATSMATGDELELAQQALTTVEGLCDCLSRVFDDVQTLIPSGFAGAAFMLVAFIAAQYACCLQEKERKGSVVGAAEMKKANRRPDDGAGQVYATRPRDALDAHSQRRPRTTYPRHTPSR